MLTPRYLNHGGVASCRDLIIGSEQIETVGTVKRRIGTMSDSTTITISTALCDRRGRSQKQ
jgi:hypothetical protein